MYLAKLEIIKDKHDEITTEKARLTAFDNEGSPFMKIGLEHFERGHAIAASFNHHGDTYLLITEK